MAHLFVQPQQKLQLNYKTTITQTCQKIKLCESPTTKELKKSHSSRWVGEHGDAEMYGDAEWAVPYPCVVDKNLDEYLVSEGSWPYTRAPSPGFQCQEDKFP